MAEKMDKLPVSVEKKQQQHQGRAARPQLLHTDVQLFNLWTLYNAVVVTISFAVVAVAYYLSPASWLLPRAATKVTDAEATQFSALLFGMLWCTTPQATAGALALLLPCDRWRVRRAAAYVALVVTVASHCMLAGAVRIVVRTHQEGLYFTIIGSAGIFISALADLLAFLVLLRAEWEY